MSNLNRDPEGFPTHLQHGTEPSFQGFPGDRVHRAEPAVAPSHSINQAQADQALDQPHGVDGHFSVDDAIQAAGLVDKPYKLGPSWVGVRGLFINDGRYFLIEGGYLFVIDVPVSHGRSLLGFFVKYVLKGWDQR